MRRVLFVVLAASAAVFVVDRVADALNSNAASGELAPFVQPSPMAPRIPSDGGITSVSVASGGSACVFVGKGLCLRLDCKAAQCDYRAAAIEADAGWPWVFVDGGLASPGDVTLPADTPESLCLPYALDSVCASFEGAGTLQAVPRYP